MRKVFLVFIIIHCITLLRAQDSTHVKHKLKPVTNIGTDSVLTIIDSQFTFINKAYLLYNNTSITLNNHFNEGYRNNAHNRITADFDYFSGSIGVPAIFAYNML